MILKNLRLQQFRNYQNCEIEFSNNVNFFVGGNAQGKTNLLEAIYLLCLARSFRGASDEELVQFSSKNFEISGKFCSDLDLEDRINLVYAKQQGKQIAINGKRLSRFSELVGRYPVISLTNIDHKITTGSPSERRLFFDILLSQISSKYLESLREYRRILKQKNMILHQAITGRRPLEKAILDTWNHRLVVVGSTIMKFRSQYTLEVSREFNIFYNTIVEQETKCVIQYNPNVPLNQDKQVEAQFAAYLEEKKANEVKFGVCLVGPHRDEFKVTVNGHELRKFGSRGEHKTALTALKGAEMVLIIKKRGERPMLLLDDLYSELDVERSAHVSTVFKEHCQIFISATSMDINILKAFSSDIFTKSKIFQVQSGTIGEITDDR